MKIATLILAALVLAAGCATGRAPDAGTVAGNPHMKRSWTLKKLQVHEHFDGTLGVNGLMEPDGTIDNGPENKAAK